MENSNKQFIQKAISRVVQSETKKVTEEVIEKAKQELESRIPEVIERAVKRVEHMAGFETVDEKIIFTITKNMV